jgi:DNA-directed RNA polymerase subunit H (RpoH/RPB5)
MASNNRILTIFKSRNTIIELLDSQEYDVSGYEKFSINEIDTMLANSQLDMLIIHKNTSKKVYVKYYLTAKQIRPTNLDEIIEDLFVIENTLTKEDTLIVITEDEPNDTIQTKMKYLFDQDHIFVVIHHIQRLQYNLLNHRLVSKCRVLDTPAEMESLKEKFNIKEWKQLPEISRFDPQALALCIRPGQICHFERDSATAMKYDYYRLCV